MMEKQWCDPFDWIDIGGGGSAGIGTGETREGIDSWPPGSWPKIP